MKEKTNNRVVIDPNDEIPDGFPFLLAVGGAFWASSVTTCNIVASNGNFDNLSASNLSLNGQPFVNSQWVNISSNFTSNIGDIIIDYTSNVAIWYESNVGILTSNPTQALTVAGNILSSNVFANGSTFNNSVIANAIIQNCVTNNSMVTLQTVANSVVQNETVINQVVNNSLINNLTIGNSINVQNQIGTQIFNTIQKSSSNNNVSCTVLWNNSNINGSIYLSLMQQVENNLYDGIKNENIKIITNPVSCLVNQSGTGIGDFQAYLSLSLNTFYTSNSVTFTSTSTLSNILINNLGVTVNFTSPNIGSILLQ